MTQSWRTNLGPELQEFMFSNELAGGNDEVGPDSSSEAASSSGSHTEDSSSSDSSSEAEAI